ncbi:hypothetical protein ACFY3I_41530, partial [Streptomyces sp. NPDC001068]
TTSKETTIGATGGELLGHAKHPVLAGIHTTIKTALHDGLKLPQILVGQTNTATAGDLLTPPSRNTTRPDTGESAPAGPDGTTVTLDTPAFSVPTVTLDTPAFSVPTLSAPVLRNPADPGTRITIPADTLRTDDTRADTPRTDTPRPHETGQPALAGQPDASTLQGITGTSPPAPVDKGKARATEPTFLGADILRTADTRPLTPDEADALHDHLRQSLGDQTYRRIITQSSGIVGRVIDMPVSLTGGLAQAAPTAHTVLTHVAAVLARHQDDPDTATGLAHDRARTLRDQLGLPSRPSPGLIGGSPRFRILTETVTPKGPEGPEGSEGVDDAVAPADAGAKPAAPEQHPHSVHRSVPDPDPDISDLVFVALTDPAQRGAAIETTVLTESAPPLGKPLPPTPDKPLPRTPLPAHPDPEEELPLPPTRMTANGQIGGADRVLPSRAVAERVTRDLVAQLWEALDLEEREALRADWQEQVQREIWPSLSAMTRGQVRTLTLKAAGFSGDVPVRARVTNAVTEGSFRSIEFEDGSESQIRDGFQREARSAVTLGLLVKGKPAEHTDLTGYLSSNWSFTESHRVVSGGRLFSRTKTSEAALRISTEVQLDFDFSSVRSALGTHFPLHSAGGERITRVRVSASVPVATGIGEVLPLSAASDTEHYRPPLRIEQTLALGGMDTVRDVFLVDADGERSSGILHTALLGTADSPLSLETYGRRTFGDDWSRIRKLVVDRVIDWDVLQYRLKGLTAGEAMEIDLGREWGTLLVSAEIESMKHVRNTARTEFNTGSDVTRVFSDAKGSDRSFRATTVAQSADLHAGPTSVTGNVYGEYDREGTAIGQQSVRSGIAVKTKVPGAVFDGVATLGFVHRADPHGATRQARRGDPPAAAGDSAPSAEVPAAPPRHGARARIGFQVLVDAADARPVPEPTPFTATERPPGPRRMTGTPLRPKDTAWQPSPEVWEELPAHTVVLDVLSGEDRTLSAAGLRRPGELVDGLGRDYFGTRWTTVRPAAHTMTTREQLAAVLPQAIRGTTARSVPLPTPLRSDAQLSLNARLESLEYLGVLDTAEVNLLSDVTGELAHRLGSAVTHGQWVQGGAQPDLTPDVTLAVHAPGGGIAHRYRTGSGTSGGHSSVASAKYPEPMVTYIATVNLAAGLGGGDDATPFEGRTQVRLLLAFPRSHTRRFEVGQDGAGPQVFTRPSPVADGPPPVHEPSTGDTGARRAQDTELAFQPPARVTGSGRIGSSDVVVELPGDRVVQGLKEQLSGAFGTRWPDVERDITRFFDSIALQPRTAGLTSGETWGSVFKAGAVTADIRVTAARAEMTRYVRVEKDFEFEQGTESVGATSSHQDRNVRRTLWQRAGFKVPHVSVVLGHVQHREFLTGRNADTRGGVVSKDKTVEPAALFDGRVTYTIEADLSHVLPGAGDGRRTFTVVSDGRFAFPVRDLPVDPATGQPPRPTQFHGVPERIARTHRLGADDVVLDVRPVTAGRTEVQDTPAAAPGVHLVEDVLRQLDASGPSVFGSDRKWRAARLKLAERLHASEFHRRLRSMMSGQPWILRVNGRELAITAGVREMSHVADTDATEFHSAVLDVEGVEHTDTHLHGPQVTARGTNLTVVGTSDPVGSAPAEIFAGGTLAHTTQDEDFADTSTGVRSVAGTKTKVPGSVFDGVARLRFEFRDRWRPFGPGVDQRIPEDTGRRQREIGLLRDRLADAQDRLDAQELRVGPLIDEFNRSHDGAGARVPGRDAGRAPEVGGLGRELHTVRTLRNEVDSLRARHDAALGEQTDRIRAAAAARLEAGGRNGFPSMTSRTFGVRARRVGEADIAFQAVVQSADTVTVATVGQAGFRAPRPGVGGTPPARPEPATRSPRTVPRPPASLWIDGMTDGQLVRDLPDVGSLRGLLDTAGRAAFGGAWTRSTRVGERRGDLVMAEFTKDRLAEALPRLTRGGELRSSTFRVNGREAWVSARAELLDLAHTRPEPKAEMVVASEKYALYSRRGLHSRQFFLVSQFGALASALESKLGAALTFGGGFRHRSRADQVAGGRTFVNAKIPTPLEHFDGHVKFTFAFHQGATSQEAAGVVPVGISVPVPQITETAGVPPHTTDRVPGTAAAVGAERPASGPVPLAAVPSGADASVTHGLPARLPHTPEPRTPEPVPDGAEQSVDDSSHKGKTRAYVWEGAGLRDEDAEVDAAAAVTDARRALARAAAVLDGVRTRLRLGTGTSTEATALARALAAYDGAVHDLAQARAHWSETTNGRSFPEVQPYEGSGLGGGAPLDHLWRLLGYPDAASTEGVVLSVRPVPASSHLAFGTGRGIRHALIPGGRDLTVAHWLHPESAEGLSTGEDGRTHVYGNEVRAEQDALARAITAAAEEPALLSVLAERGRSLQEDMRLFETLVSRPEIHKLLPSQRAAVVMAERRGLRTVEADLDRLAGNMRGTTGEWAWARSYPQDRSGLRALLTKAHDVLRNDMSLTVNVDLGWRLPDGRTVLDSMTEGPRLLRNAWEVLPDSAPQDRGSAEEALGYPATVKRTRKAGGTYYRPDARHTGAFAPTPSDRAQLPKYASLTSKYLPTGALAYGSTVFHLKHALMQRATFTPRDSIELANGGANSVTGSTNLLPLLNEGLPDLVRLVFAEATDFRHDARLRALRDEGGLRSAVAGYFEAQLHGDVHWEDVDRIVLVPRPGEPVQSRKLRLEEFARAGGHTFTIEVFAPEPPVHRVSGPPAASYTSGPAHRDPQPGPQPGLPDTGPTDRGRSHAGDQQDNDGAGELRESAATEPGDTDHGMDVLLKAHAEAVKAVEAADSALNKAYSEYMSLVGQGDAADPTQRAAAFTAFSQAEEAVNQAQTHLDRIEAEAEAYADAHTDSPGSEPAPDVSAHPRPDSPEPLPDHDHPTHQNAQNDHDDQANDAHPEAEAETWTEARTTLTAARHTFVRAAFDLHDARVHDEQAPHDSAGTPLASPPDTDADTNTGTDADADADADRLQRAWNTYVAAELTLFEAEMHWVTVSDGLPLPKPPRSYEPGLALPDDRTPHELGELLGDVHRIFDTPPRAQGVMKSPPRHVPSATHTALTPRQLGGSYPLIPSGQDLSVAHWLVPGIGSAQHRLTNGADGTQAFETVRDEAYEADVRAERNALDEALAVSEDGSPLQEALLQQQRSLRENIGVYEILKSRQQLRDLRPSQLASVVMAERRAQRNRSSDMEELTSRLMNGAEQGRHWQWTDLYPFDPDNVVGFVSQAESFLRDSTHLIVNVSLDKVLPSGETVLSAMLSGGRMLRNAWEVGVNVDEYLDDRAGVEEALGYPATVKRRADAKGIYPVPAGTALSATHAPTPADRSELPIYANLNVRYRPKGLTAYGNAVFHIKSDLLGRATFTPQDSFNGKEGARSITGLSNLLPLLLKGDPALVRLVFAEATDFRYDTRYRTLRESGDLDKALYLGYFEAQLHGGVDWNDLDRIVLLDGESPGTTAETRHRLEEFARANGHSFLVDTLVDAETPDSSDSPVAPAPAPAPARNDTTPRLPASDSNTPVAYEEEGVHPSDDTHRGMEHLAEAHAEAREAVDAAGSVFDRAASAYMALVHQGDAADPAQRAAAFAAFNQSEEAVTRARTHLDHIEAETEAYADGLTDDASDDHARRSLDAATAVAEAQLTLERVTSTLDEIRARIRRGVGGSDDETRLGPAYDEYVWASHRLDDARSQWQELTGGAPLPRVPR